MVFTLLLAVIAHDGSSLDDRQLLGLLSVLLVGISSPDSGTSVMKHSLKA